jgi:hypothetical protein
MSSEVASADGVSAALATQGLSCGLQHESVRDANAQTSTKTSNLDKITKTTPIAFLTRYALVLEQKEHVKHRKGAKRKAPRGARTHSLKISLDQE